jgi:hypothetical protein
MIKRYITFSLLCATALFCVAGTGQRDNQFQNDWRQNTCNTSDSKCTIKLWTECKCKDCGNPEASHCICKQVLEDTYIDEYHGSCAELTGSGEIKLPNFEVSVGGKKFLCSFSDPTTNYYSCQSQCGREGDDENTCGD